MASNAVIFSGSFNPIHIGHLVIANYVVEFTSADEFWFVVSPHNPFKSKSELADFRHRFNMVKISFEGLDLPVVVSDMENTLTQPSYTINTINALSEKYPEKEWSLLIGADNLLNFHHWKDASKIVERHRLLAYPRAGFDDDELYRKNNATKLDAPIMEISSTFIRDNISKGHNLRALLPDGVFEYIHEHELYGTKRI
ncbi:MAG: nicotinate-nucleotide adenylyltransferase [Prevotellaceae bacterium]|jgi:nicotinate-nucleotide adenylyltransferase|nr:nicotinate-nucleotide adenylyltransferase [Prevotellaceae bacterium]